MNNQKNNIRENRSELSLRDFIYFDFEKAASIYSQVEGGFITEFETKLEENKQKNHTHKYDVKLYKPEHGKSESEKSTLLETRILHHDLFTKIENLLFSNNLALDISKSISIKDLESGTAHLKLKEAYYIRSTGWAVIEDYNRIKNIALKFNKISEFIARCAVSEIEVSQEYQKLQEQLNLVQVQIKSENNRNKRTILQKKLDQTKIQLENYLREITGLGSVPEWLIEGMSEFIDIFMKGNINLRIYPFEEFPSFSIISNLKKECFVDSDLDNLIFAYGINPNVKLSVFGLITSIPDKSGTKFDYMSEFEDIQSESSNDDQKAFEKGFRNMFKAFEGFDNMVRYSRYPNITIYPIAVYRDIT